MALANVTLLNTFDEWRTRTNQIIYNLDQLNSNNSNIAANTANLQSDIQDYLPLAGGTLTGNVTFSGTNIIIDLLG